MLFHISHTDLDGYGCQLITKEMLSKEQFKKAFFYNANYGTEVKLTIKKVLEEIEDFKEEEIFFLISDLNLTTQESKDLDRNINILNDNGLNIKLQVRSSRKWAKKCRCL